MNSPKLLEAIAELEAQRAVIDDAIMHMRRAYISLGGNTDAAAMDVPLHVNLDRVVRRRRRGGNSYVDEAVAAIQEAGHALHITDILARIKVSRADATRASVESSMIREMKAARKAKRESRILRSGPSTFDISRSLALAS